MQAPAGKARGAAGPGIIVCPSVDDVRQQGHLTGPLNCPGHLALMAGTVAADAAGKNFAPLRQIAAQAAGVFVIDHLHFIEAEMTNSAPSPAVASSQ